MHCFFSCNESKEKLYIKQNYLESPSNHSKDIIPIKLKFKINRLFAKGIIAKEKIDKIDNFLSLLNSLIG